MRRFRKTKIALLIILLILVYEAVGACLVFVMPRDVSREFAESVDVSTFYSNSVGVDKAMILEDSITALDMRLKILNEAKETILFSCFQVQADESCKDIFAVINAAAERGVKVQILVDGLAGVFKMKFDPMYYALAANENVEIKYYNMPNIFKPWTMNGRMHDKLIVVDNKYLIFGGRNTSDYFLGEYNEKVLSYDRDILVYNSEHEDVESRSSVIFHVKDYFNYLYYSEYSDVYYKSIPVYKKRDAESCMVMYDERYDAMIEEDKELFNTAINVERDMIPTNKITFIYNPTYILSKEPWVWYQVDKLMENASDRVVIQTPYAVLDDSMYTDLGEIAAMNLDEFTLMVNSTAVADNVVASADYTFNKDKIINTGVDLYEFQTDHSTHNKSILIDDDISIVGSYNVDLRSTYVDTETMFVINGTEFNAELEKVMNDMKDQALQVDDTGEYIIEADSVEAVPLSKGKGIFYKITSYIAQLFRYLI